MFDVARNSSEAKAVKAGQLPRQVAGETGADAENSSYKIASRNKQFPVEKLWCFAKTLETVQPF